MDNREQVSDQVFHILLSLADEPRHGYGIIQDVEARTEGTLTLGSGTLYSAIKRMRERGWVQPVRAPRSGDARRKYYGLTKTGRAVMHAEADRLADLVRYAKAKDVLRESAG